jgi:hypothetical protein
MHKSETLQRYIQSIIANDLLKMAGYTFANVYLNDVLPGVMKHLEQETGS